MNKTKIFETIKYVRDLLFVDAVYEWIVQTSSRLIGRVLLLGGLWLGAVLIADSLLLYIIPQATINNIVTIDLTIFGWAPELMFVNAVVMTMKVKEEVTEKNKFWYYLHLGPTIIFGILIIEILEQYLAYLAWHLPMSTDLPPVFSFIVLSLRVLSGVTFSLTITLYAIIVRKSGQAEEIVGAHTKVKSERRKTEKVPVQTTVRETETDQKLIESPKDIIETESKTESETETDIKVISFEDLKGQAKSNAYLESLSESDQVYFWNNRKELSEKIGVSVKTIERSYASICPEAKVKKA